jgi:hypothetical protein
MTLLRVFLGGCLLMVLLALVGPLIVVMTVLNAHRGGRPPRQAIRLGPMIPPQAMPGMPGGAAWPIFPGAIPAGASVTDVVGGRGGGEQSFCDPQGRPLVGLAYALDDRWDRQGTVIGALQPIFDPQSPAVDWRGEALTAVTGREGYVVGGLWVDAGEYVNAVKIIFVRRNGETLDLTDSYDSEWLGTPRGEEPRKLAGDGPNVIGLHCKQGLVLDGIGLVVRPGAAPREPPDEPMNPFETIVNP